MDEKYIFISYSSKNKKLADKLRDYFLEKNISIWMAPYSIPVSATYASEINEGISNCSLFLLLLTEDSMNSKHVLNELNLVSNQKCPVFTFKFGDFSLNSGFEYYLGSAQIEVMKKLDFNSESFQKAFKQICVTLETEDVIESAQSNKKKVNIFKKKWFSISIIGIIILSLAVGIGFYTKSQKVNSSTGKTVTMGLYNDTNIEWIVLDENEKGEKLLLSKYILDLRTYNEENEEVTWETCTLRKWLNNDFYSSVFDEEEQAKILTTNLENADNPKYRTNGGNNTEDKVFLLSVDEINTYFKTKDKKSAIRLDNNEAWRYWLRSSGYDNTYASVTYRSGLVSQAGSNVIDKICGVRPALWVSE